MSSLDNSKPVVVPVTLKGENYMLWSRTTKIALCGRGLWSHIDKSSKPVYDQSDGEDKDSAMEREAKWFQEDQTVLAILQNSLEVSILEAYSYCETAEELWETLKNVYGNISNLSRVYEVKKAINNLHQEDMEFTKHFGKYRSLWAELEMLRPSSIDPKVLNERKEQDKVFGLLLTLNPAFNDLIKHILRSEKLPSLEDVCSQIQREQGSQGLFGGKGELPTANKGVYNRFDNRGNKGGYGNNRPGSKARCEHCKGRHTKETCWILHPELKPSWWIDNPRNPRANYTTSKPDQDSTGSSKQGEEANQGDYVRKSDLEALIKAFATQKESGKTYFTHTPSSSLVVDSGASHHMISNSRMLDNIESTNGNVMIANGDNIPIKGIGTLKVFDKESKAFYMPTFTSNLLSVKRATKDLNCYAIFGPNDVHFQDIDSGKIIGEGRTKDELYVLEDFSPSSFSFKSCLGIANNALWHARLGHPHSRAFELMLPNVYFDHKSCESCILGKHCKTVFPNSTTIYEKCFDLVHSDVWTSPCISRDNNKYFVTFIDEKSKYTWITLLPSKDRVLEAFINFQTYVTNQFNAKIKIFRTDNGGEYTSHRFKDHLSMHGILHQTSCPYTPQQNGVAERKNRHLMEVSRAMMFHMNVPKSFWGDAVMMACYLINRTPTKILEDISPFEVLNNTRPFIEHLRVFGCVCFVLVPGELRTKLDAKSTRCMFIGYSTTQKGYKCYDPSSRRTFVSKDVKFMEEKSFYGAEKKDELREFASSTDYNANLRFLLQHLGNPEAPKTRESAHSPVQEEVTQEEEVQEPPPVQEEVIQEEEVQEAGHDENPVEQGQDQEAQEEVTPDNGTSDVEVQDEVVGPVLRRSTRIRKDPSQWKETRVYYNNEAVAHPLQAVCSLARLPSSHRAFVTKIDEHTIPKTYEEAMEDAHWVEAVDDEVGAMVKNHTWDEADLPEGKRTVSSKWVFTIKYLSNGDLERYKARLVARGFTQTYGDDYTDTFAPVAKLNTVRVVFSLAANLNWDLWQMDVKNAFLQGDLDEEVYMTPPPGLENSIAPGKVLKLKKAIYGLKQSPRAWYKKLSSTLKEKGFKKCELDHTLFTLQGPNGIVVVLIYVDDMIISGSDKQGIQETKDYLNSVFEMKDLGEVKYFLGIEVCRFENGLHISQRKYTLDLLKETGKLGAKPAKTPLEEGYKGDRKGEKADEPYEDPSRYRRLVGKLIYLTLTRPDISFAVNQISQHMKEPTVYHWQMVERILRYLKDSPGLGVWMGKNESSEVVGYCDADWAGDRNDRRSTTGYCTFIGGNLVTWRTKKQKVVSCSSAEAEYRAMKKLTNELTWLRGILAHLGIETDKPMIMHCDNQAAIHIATNSVFHERTKHIEIDCHKVREKIEQGWTLPCFTRSEDQLADVFTKAASLKVCNHILGKLGLVDLTHP